MKTSVIVNSHLPLTLVGGGAASLADMDAARKLAPDVVAADGGAALCLASGCLPRAVIGDMDSLSAAHLEQIPKDRVHPIPEQDSTDFDKVLRSISAPMVIGVGFLGRRIDHELAALNRLAARADKKVILVGADDVIFLAPPRLELALAPGARVSLFPMTPITGKSTGLNWPIDGLDMAPDMRIGTSNHASGPVTLAFERPGMLILLDRGALEMAAAAFMAAPSWPAGDAAPEG